MTEKRESPHPEGAAAMILGDLVVLILIVAPVALTVLALRANPRQLVDRFGPAVR